VPAVIADVAGCHPTFPPLTLQKLNPSTAALACYKRSNPEIHNCNVLFTFNIHFTVTNYIDKILQTRQRFSYELKIQQNNMHAEREVERPSIPNRYFT
jgi:hypothetical protein